MRVVVTPVIGCVSRDRLASMTGTHALHEKAVVRRVNGPDAVGAAIAEAMYEIALGEAAGGRVPPPLEEMNYLVQFRG